MNNGVLLIIGIFRLLQLRVLIIFSYLLFSPSWPTNSQRNCGAASSLFFQQFAEKLAYLLPSA